MQLDALVPGATLRGLVPDAAVTVVSVQWHGADALTLTYRDPAGRVAEEILYRHDEPRLSLVDAGRPWSFDGDGGMFRLVAEAQRIRLAHLFDPVLADDSGAGKTNIAGLLIKELIARGDLTFDAPGSCPGLLVRFFNHFADRRKHAA